MASKNLCPSKAGFNFRYTFRYFILVCLIASAFSISIHNHNNQHSVTQISIHNLGLIRNSHHQQKVYDQGEYLAKLAGIQNTFKSQILDIQTDFVSINLMLNDSSLDDGQKKIKLQEALADERDSLRDIQNSLKVPYALKSCQCIDLNEQQKKDIQVKLDAVGKKINDLEKQSKKAASGCQDPNDCPLTTELNEQIKIMLNYQAIMQETISSQCCKVVKRAYKDNLDSNNWHFGSTTQQDYQTALFKRQQTEKVSLVPCSFNVPYVDGNNSCFSCPDTKPLFNLGSRKCEKDCSQYSGNQAFVLNLTTHICGYNKNCPTNQYFDTTLLRCVTTPNYYNDSSCPPQKPFWDPKSLSCSFCLAETPYYDIILKKCRACYQNETWSQVKKTCEGEVKCGIDQIFNHATNQCVKKQTSNSHSLCPPDRPFWDQINYSCDACPMNKPYFDPILSYCRTCNSNQTFNNVQKVCQNTSNVSCLKGQFYSTQTKKCQKTGTTSMCPPQTPFWDSENYKCLKCPLKTPIFNQITRKCQQCTLNTTWSQTQQICISVCSSDQSWDSQYKKCIKKNRLCQPKQVFNISLNKCIQVKCDIDMPFWNLTAQECQVCPQYTLYNIQNNICQKDNRFGNVSVCQASKPVWNSQILRCESCPVGTTWSSIQTQCVTSRAHFKKTRSHLDSIESHRKAYGHVYGNQKISYQHKNLPLNIN